VLEKNITKIDMAIDIVMTNDLDNETNTLCISFIENYLKYNAYELSVPRIKKMLSTKTTKLIDIFIKNTNYRDDFILYLMDISIRTDNIDMRNLLVKYF